MRWMVAIAFLVFLAPAAVAEEDGDAWAPHRKLKVLYAGKEGGSREKTFAAFLEQHFDTSATLPLGKLSMETAKGFDVVIVDWVSQYGNDGYDKSDHGVPIQLGPEFTKPFVTMTYVGTMVRQGYKLDWL